MTRNYEEEGYKCLSPGLRENPKGFVEALTKNLKGMVVGFGDASVHGDQTWLRAEMEVHGFRLVEEQVSSKVSDVWGEYTEGEKAERIGDSDFKTVYTLYALANENGVIDEEKLCKLDMGDNDAYLFWHEPTRRYVVGEDVDYIIPCWEVCFEVKRRAFQMDDDACVDVAGKCE